MQGRRGGASLQDRRSVPAHRDGCVSRPGNECRTRSQVARSFPGPRRLLSGNYHTNRILPQPDTTSATDRNPAAQRRGIDGPPFALPRQLLKKFVVRRGSQAKQRGRSCRIGSSGLPIAKKGLPQHDTGSITTHPRLANSPQGSNPMTTKEHRRPEVRSEFTLDEARRNSGRQNGRAHPKIHTSPHEGPKSTSLIRMVYLR